MNWPRKEPEHVDRRRPSQRQQLTVEIDRLAPDHRRRPQRAPPNQAQPRRDRAPASPGRRLRHGPRGAVVRERAARQRQHEPVDALQRSTDLGRLDTDPRPGVGKRRTDRRRRRLEHRNRKLGPVMDHQMRTGSPARSSHPTHRSSSDKRRQLRPDQRVNRAARPDRRTNRARIDREVNCPVKNPNTSIDAVPANANNSPSRSIVWLPTTGAVPNAAAQSSATAVVTVPPAPGRRRRHGPRRAVVRERAARQRQHEPVDPLQRSTDLGRLDTDPRPGVGKRRTDRRRRRLEHRNRKLGPVMDHQMRTSSPARSSLRPIKLERQGRQLRPDQRVNRAARPDRRADRARIDREVNCPVKNPNTSIVAVPANENSSPSRSIVWLPTTGAVPNAAAQSSATAS